jgi:hypothetical protein
MKTKIILDIKWLQEKRKTRPGKMIQTTEFLYLGKIIREYELFI